MPSEQDRCEACGSWLSETHLGPARKDVFWFRYGPQLLVAAGFVMIVAALFACLSLVAGF